VSRLALGIDAGGTATRWRLESGAGILVAEGVGPPASGHIDDPVLGALTFAALASLAEQAGAHGRIGAVFAGITGLDERSPAAGRIAAFLAERLAAPAVRVVDDMWIAYHSAFAPGEGIIVYGGTGSVGYHVTSAGEASRAGGHGYLLDDGGSAAWIGLRALRALVRGLDEDPAAMRGTLLHAALAEAIGSAEWESVRAFVYGGDRGRIGGLAPAVAGAAERGDAAAAALLRQAGAELARLAQVLIGRHGEKPVALLGGAIAASPLIAAGIAEHLGPDTDFRRPSRTPVEAAATLARALSDRA